MKLSQMIANADIEKTENEMISSNEIDNTTTTDTTEETQTTVIDNDALQAEIDAIKALIS